MIFQIIRIKTSILIFFLVIICHVVSAQKRFELVAGIDPLHFQLDNSTEDGMGFYDIRYKRKITQSANLNFIYWLHPDFGISLGGCIRNFGSKMSYEVPDPSLLTNSINFSNEINFKAIGHGFTGSVYFRQNRFRIAGGLSLIGLSDLKYNKDAHISVTSIANSEGTYARIQIDENSYWSYVPRNYVLYHFNVEYNLTGNLYLKGGFETTNNNSKYSIYPIMVRITGFTAGMEPDSSRVLNDFKIKDSFASLFIGVAYVIGIGKKYE